MTWRYRFGRGTAVWLAGSKEAINRPHLGIGPSSIAHETIEVLRKSGLLDDIIDTKEGLVIYPVEMGAEE